MFTSDPFFLSVIRNGFQILVQSNFIGVFRKTSVTPKDPKVIHRIQEEIRDLKNANVQINDFSEFVFVPDLCDPQEFGVSACHPESQRVQSFHFNPTFRDVDSERYFSTAVSERLGCVFSFERCLPPHSGSSAIQEVFGFPIHGHDFSVQGSAFRPHRLTMGLYKGSVYSCGPSPPSRTPSLLLSGRLAPSDGVQGALGASSSDDPAMDPGSGIPGELEEVFSGTAETPFLSRDSAGHPVLGISPAVAWLPPSYGQNFSAISPALWTYSPLLQDADETSSASLPAVLLSLD